MICYWNNAFDINLIASGKMYVLDYVCGMFMEKCVRCKKKIREEPTYAGSPPRPHCKACAAKVTA